jgi:hypothetical protein
LCTKLHARARFVLHSNPERLAVGGDSRLKHSLSPCFSHLDLTPVSTDHHPPPCARGACRFSATFGLVLPEAARDAGNGADNSNGSDDNAALSTRLAAYIEAERAATEQRIRDYERAQREAFEKLCAEAEKAKDDLLRLFRVYAHGPGDRPDSCECPPHTHTHTHMN